MVGIAKVALFALVSVACFSAVDARDQYEILGVSGSADTRGIRKAYRERSSEFHPDKHKGADEAKMKELQKKMEELTLAFRTLSDPENRKRYDSDGKLAGEGGDTGGGNGQAEQAGVEDSAGSWFVLLCGALCFAVPLFLASGKKKPKKSGTPRGLRKSDGSKKEPSNDPPIVAYLKDLSPAQMVILAIVAFLVFQVIMAPKAKARGSEGDAADTRTPYQKEVDTCLEYHGRRTFNNAKKCFSKLAEKDGKSDPVVLGYYGDSIFQKGDTGDALAMLGRAYRKLPSACKSSGTDCAKGDKEKGAKDLFDVKMFIMRNQAAAYVKLGRGDEAIQVGQKALKDASASGDRQSEHIHFIRESVGAVIGQMKKDKKKEL